MLENLFAKISGFYLVIIGVVAVIFYDFINTISVDRKIRRLGGRAPKRKAWLPFGIDLAYGGTKALLRNESLEYFQDGLTRFANPRHPYTMELEAGGQRILVTSDDVNIKAILATQFSDYGKGKKFNEDWHDFLGDSIFTTDGEQWHNSRQLIRPQFIKDRLSDIDIFEKHVSVLIPQLGQGRTIDVLDLFFRFTLDASTDFLLGRSVGSLSHGQIDFADAFNEVQHIQSIIARAGNFNWIIPRKRFNQQLKVLNEFVEPYIEDALRLSPQELEKRTKSDEGYTFLHALAGYTRDRTILRDQLVAVLLAGRDTTACTLGWLIYEVSKKPQIVRKLRAEILDRVGPTKQPTYENLKSMKYLQHCLNETLRLYPIVPFNVRLALKDTTLPHGSGEDGLQPVGVLKGTPVAYSTLSMQRREDIYPPKESGFPAVLEFVPERWDIWTPKSWTYIPFNGGPRICIGQQFALTEMAYTVTRIFQKYDRLENRMAAPAREKADIVLQPLTGVQVAFHASEK